MKHDRPFAFRAGSGPRRDPQDAYRGDEVKRTLSDVVAFVRDRSDASAFKFTRKFYLENNRHDSWKEKMGDVLYVNIKGRLNNCRDGYEPAKSQALHSDALAAADWVFVEVDAKREVILILEECQ